LSTGLSIVLAIDDQAVYYYAEALKQINIILDQCKVAIVVSYFSNFSAFSDIKKLESATNKSSSRGQVYDSES